MRKSNLWEGAIPETNRIPPVFHHRIKPCDFATIFMPCQTNTVGLAVLTNRTSSDNLNWYAGVAQLVELHVANVVVAGSSPVSCSYFWQAGAQQAAPLLVFIGAIAKW